MSRKIKVIVAILIFTILIKPGFAMYQIIDKKEEQKKFNEIVKKITPESLGLMPVNYDYPIADNKNSKKENRSYDDEGNITNILEKITLPNSDIFFAFLETFFKYFCAWLIISTSINIFKALKNKTISFSKIMEKTIFAIKTIFSNYCIRVITATIIFIAVAFFWCKILKCLSYTDLSTLFTISIISLLGMLSYYRQKEKELYKRYSDLKDKYDKLYKEYRKLQDKKLKSGLSKESDENNEYISKDEMKKCDINRIKKGVLCMAKKCKVCGSEYNLKKINLFGSFKDIPNSHWTGEGYICQKCLDKCEYCSKCNKYIKSADIINALGNSGTFSFCRCKEELQELIEHEHAVIETTINSTKESIFSYKTKLCIADRDLASVLKISTFDLRNTLKTNQELLQDNFYELDDKQLEKIRHKLSFYKTSDKCYLFTRKGVELIANIISNELSENELYSALIKEFIINENEINVDRQ